MTSVSIIIPTWNGRQWINACLQAIGNEPANEIIVVDNGSSDGTPEVIARDAPRVRLLRLPRNLGFAAAVNRGLRAAHGDVLILINQDVVVQPGCLSTLVQRLYETGSAIAGCKLLYPDGRTIQHAGGVITYPRAVPDHHGYGQLDDGRWDAVTQVDYVTGAVFAMPRAVWEALGEFDEAFYPAYYEEVDYCFRARSAGFAVIYEPRATAIHHESQSSDRRSTLYHRAMERGRLRFVLKHMPVDQICDAFSTAESTHVLHVPRAHRQQVLRHAYMHALLSVPDLYVQRTFDDASALKVIASLSHLQRLASEGTSHERENTMDDRSQPVTLLELEEFQFQSHVPIIGPLIRGVRRGLYALASKWAMRYLMQQQNHINQTLAQTAREYHDRLEEYDARLIDQDRDLVFLTRTLAELELRQRQWAKGMLAPGAATQTPE